MIFSNPGYKSQDQRRATPLCDDCCTELRCAESYCAESRPAPCVHLSVELSLAESPVCPVWFPVANYPPRHHRPRPVVNFLNQTFKFHCVTVINFSSLLLQATDATPDVEVANILGLIEDLKTTSGPCSEMAF